MKRKGEVTMTDNTNQNYLEQEEVIEKAKDPRRTIKRLIGYLLKQKARFVLTIIFVIISSALALSAPLVVGQAVDILFKGMSSNVPFSQYADKIANILMVLGTLYLFNSLFTYFNWRLMSDVSQNLTLTLRKEISEKLTKLPLNYYDTHQKGDTLSRATNDLEKIADSLQEGLLQLITSIVVVIAAIIIMITISPVLTLIVVLTIVVSIFITIKFSGKIEKSFSDNQQNLGKLNSKIEEAFTGQMVIKSFNHEEEAIADFNEINNQLIESNSKAQFSVHSISPLIKALGKVGYILVAVVGGIAVLNGTMTLGGIQAFIQYVNMCLEPTAEASYILSMLQGAMASAERVFELLDEDEEIPEKANAKLLENATGKVTFEDVFFGYSDDKILMEHMDISVSPGEKFAIVGPTGAGKTTLINLLMRFYEIQSGAIKVDDIDITELKRGNLRKTFGMVLQDTWLFSGTIRDNLSYGKPEASLEEVKEAAKAARAHHFIMTLPDGYDTVLDEEGSNVSQGQRQLLTIARAILADPTILILDEATSSVDTRTEAEIQTAMNKLMEGRTSFVIAHRLSTIRDADCILVMKDGTIIEQGSHNALMAKKGFYEDLYNSQFASKAVME